MMSRAQWERIDLKRLSIIIQLLLCFFFKNSSSLSVHTDVRSIAVQCQGFVPVTSSVDVFLSPQCVNVTTHMLPPCKYTHKIGDTGDFLLMCVCLLSEDYFVFLSLFVKV